MEDEDRLRGHQWFTIRQSVLSRDNYTCQNCKASSNLVVHHIVPITDRGTNNLSNLITLCRKCHRASHGQKYGTNTQESVQETHRDYLTTREMRQICSSLPHPFTLAIILTLAKTGIGVGELCNLDRNDIYISDIDSDHIGEIKGSGLIVRCDDDTPYSNRRERSDTTLIPINQEHETVLKRWLAIRPDPLDGKPLFMSCVDNWGERITPATVRSILKKIDNRFHLYDSDENHLTPLDLRYFFQERFKGDPNYRKYILGYQDGSNIDFKKFESGYHKSIFDLIIKSG